MFGCVGSSFLCEGFLQLRQAGATLHRGARASHYRGLSCCRAQAPDAQAQQLWLTGLVAPRHVESSQTRAQTHVPCIGRQILNHCATREAQQLIFLIHLKKYLSIYLSIYLWLRWVFVAARGLSLVAASGGYSLLRCTGFSLRWLLLLRSTGSRPAGFSSCGMQAQQLWLAGSRVQSQQLWYTSLVAPRHAGSSWARDRTHVPCIGRRILNHCATREVPAIDFWIVIF